ncbi:TPR repeat protein [Elusimicrobium simillimum]|uniref:hypothetical protein n=1 Tax=Elusimicrobium simillimum TaxID=3143438 RepID=UPI003C6F2195
MKKVIILSMCVLFAAACAKTVKVENTGYMCSAQNAVKAGNIEDAKRVYGDACAKGAANACNQAAFIALEQENTAQAQEYFLMACSKSEKSGCYNAGLIKEGNGDAAGAKKLYKKACKKGLAKACEANSNI